MTKLQFVLSLPEIDPSSEAATEFRLEPLIIALEALTQINEWHLRNRLAMGKPLPRLYSSGVYYEEEPPGKEDWQDIETLYHVGKGDCEDLGAALTAERRVYDGIQSNTIVKTKYIPTKELIAGGYRGKDIPSKGLFLVHVLSQLPDGTIEDPSKVLGMKGEYK